MYQQCMLVLCDAGLVQSVHAPCSEPRLQCILWYSVGECCRKHLTFIVWIWVNFLTFAYPEGFYCSHIFHSPHISYLNLHGATAHRLRSSEYRGLFSSVSFRLSFRPMNFSVWCLMHILYRSSTRKKPNWKGLWSNPGTHPFLLHFPSVSHFRLQLTSSLAHPLSALGFIPQSAGSRFISGKDI